VRQEDNVNDNLAARLQRSVRRGVTARKTLELDWSGQPRQRAAQEYVDELHETTKLYRAADALCRWPRRSVTGSVGRGAWVAAVFAAYGWFGPVAAGAFVALWQLGHEITMRIDANREA
jgi:hypothetical protein